MGQTFKLYLTYISFFLIITLMLMTPSMSEHILNDTGYATRQATVYPYINNHLKQYSLNSLSYIYMNKHNLYQKKAKKNV